MAPLYLVDDDPLIRRSLKMLLEMEGHQVHCAENGQEALELLKCGDPSPCVILLDLMMPVMDGIEFKRRQLQDPGVSHVPVIFMTGKDVPGNADELRPLKIVRKPFKADVIIELIDEYCS